MCRRWGFEVGEHALVLRRTLPLVAAQDERSLDKRASQVALMLSRPKVARRSASANLQS